MIRVTARTEEAKKTVKAITEALKPAKIDRVIGTAAFKCQAELVKITPKKWFGQVRRAWRTEKPEVAIRKVVNTNKIMAFLELGTKDHGPKTAKFLYIPLKRSAVVWRPGLICGGVSWGSRPRGFNQSGVITRKAIKVKNADYILAKWVRGIQPRYIVRGFVPTAEKILYGEMIKYLQGVKNGMLQFTSTNTNQPS